MATHNEAIAIPIGVYIEAIASNPTVSSLKGASVSQVDGQPRPSQTRVQRQVKIPCSHNTLVRQRRSRSRKKMKESPAVIVAEVKSPIPWQHPLDLPSLPSQHGSSMLQKDATEVEFPIPWQHPLDLASLPSQHGSSMLQKDATEVEFPIPRGIKYPIQNPVLPVP